MAAGAGRCSVGVLTDIAKRIDEKTGQGRRTEVGHGGLHHLLVECVTTHKIRVR